MKFEIIEYAVDADGRETFTPTGQTETLDCSLVLLAIGQNNAFPWIEKDLGIEFNERGLAKVNADTFQSTLPQVFLGRCGTRSEKHYHSRRARSSGRDLN